DSCISKSIRQEGRSADIRQVARTAESVLHSTGVKTSAHIRDPILCPMRDLTTSAPARDHVHRAVRHGADGVRGSRRGHDFEDHWLRKTWKVMIERAVRR